ncbi:hypothetical protein ACFXDO_22890 [Streptomyces nigra]|uniref:hypothetical protein n=1 Tax=Streptomyces nigra TaxID=1827580 RepID=UPI0036A747AE
MSYEGQTAVALESTAGSLRTCALAWRLRRVEGLWVYDPAPTLTALLGGPAAGARWPSSPRSSTPPSPRSPRRRSHVPSPSAPRAPCAWPAASRTDGCWAVRPGRLPPSAHVPAGPCGGRWR